MRYFKYYARDGVGPFFGMEEDTGRKWIWEDGCFQIFPDPTISYIPGLEYIKPIDFFRFMKKHSEMMVDELSKTFFGSD